MAMRCFWPPDICTPRSPTAVSYLHLHLRTDDEAPSMLQADSTILQAGKRSSVAQRLLQFKQHAHGCTCVRAQVVGRSRTVPKAVATLWAGC